MNRTDPILQEFYSQDASLKRMNHSDQTRLFAEWAERRGFNLSLHFKRKIETKPIRVAFFAISALILLLELSFGNNNLSAMLWTALFFLVYQNEPILIIRRQSAVATTD